MCVLLIYKKVSDTKEGKKKSKKKKKKWFTDEIQLSLAETLGSMSETTERNGVLAFSVLFYLKVKFQRCLVAFDAKKAGDSSYTLAKRFEFPS